MGCCQPVLGPIENYYTKNQIDRMIDEIESSGCCITEEEVDEKIESAKTEIESEIPSLSGYATEQWVEDKHYITGVDLSNYATLDDIPDLVDYALKSEIPTSNSALTNDAGYLTEHQQLKTINNQSLIGTGNIEIGTGGTIDLSNYYNKQETDSLLDDKLDASAYTPTDLSNYYTKSETNSQIGSATAGMATQQWVLDKHYISGVDLSNYATLQDIPTVPTSNSAFTNDMGYLTEHQQLKTINSQSLIGSGNITIEPDNNKQNIASNGYINTVAYTASTAPYNYTSINFRNAENSGDTTANTVTYPLYVRTINGYDIVSTSTFNSQLRLATEEKFNSHSGNTSLHVSSTEKTTWNNKVDSSTLNNYLLKSKIWCGTQSQYDSITTKDPETLYLIHS